MKITLIVHNLSGNPIVRVYPIALALERLGYEIEVAGFLIGKNQVYQPYANKFDYKTVFISNSGFFNYLTGLSKLLKLINGDIIYTFKPLMTSYFVGLLKSRFGTKRKLILDVEDDELVFKYKNWIRFLYSFFIKGWNNHNAHLKLLILHLFLWPAREKTVVSSKLQKRYGGKIILHGPDENVFNPDLYNKIESRKKFHLPIKQKLILFAGVPHEYKGIRTIIEALEIINNKEFIFVCAGPPEHDMFKEAKKRLGSKCILLGKVDNSKMASLLAAVDITPTLQKRTKFTESQIPAKLLEAMAMEKIIIATDTSDIGKILGKNTTDKKGYLIDFDDPSGFASTLISIVNSMDEANLYAKRAREFYIQEASVKANSNKLKLILE